MKEGERERERGRGTGHEPTGMEATACMLRSVSRVERMVDKEGVIVLRCSRSEGSEVEVEVEVPELLLLMRSLLKAEGGGDISEPIASLNVFSTPTAVSSSPELDTVASKFDECECNNS